LRSKKYSGSEEKSKVLKSWHALTEQGFLRRMSLKVSMSSQPIRCKLPPYDNEDAVIFNVEDFEA
jgi:hypothetical protein